MVSGRWFFNWHKISLSLICQWCHSTCCNSDLFESLGSEDFLSRFCSSGFAPLDDLCVRLDVRIQRVFKFLIQLIRDDCNEVCAKLFGYEPHKLLTVLLNELYPLVQVRRKVVHGPALWEISQQFSAAGIDEFSGAVALSVQLTPHLQSVTGLVSAQCKSPLFQCLGNPCGQECLQVACDVPCIDSSNMLLRQFLVEHRFGLLLTPFE